MRLITSLTIAALNAPTLSFDGSNYILSEVDGLASPTVRLPRYNLPGSSGGFVSNALYGERSLKIKGWVNAPDGTRNIYLANRLNLINALAFQRDVNNTLVPQTVTITLENGQVLTTTGYIDTPLQLKFSEEQPDYEQFLFTMVMPDPALYAVTPISGTITVPIAGGAAIPATIPMSLAPSSGGSLTLTNPGSLPSLPIITLSAPLTNPFITNTRNGAFLKINYTLNVGDSSLVINCNTQSIMQGSSDRTGIQSTDSTFWGIFPGDNTLSLNATSGNGIAVISFNAAYTGA